MGALAALCSREECQMSRIARINLAWLIALPAAVLSAPPTVVDLGENMLPQSVSDSGAVVVGLAFAEDNPGGVFRWTPRGGTQLIGGLVAGRPDVSADGTAIAATVAAEGIEAAFWTERSGWIPLSATDLVPALPGWASVPHVISANGKRLAGGTIPPPVDYGWERAFSFNPDTWDDRWADYGWQELPKAGKGSLAWASGISDDGTVQVGTASERSSTFFAARWVDGRIRELRDGNGVRLGGETVVCNSKCNVIAGGGGPSSAIRPVLAWRLRVNSRAPACYFAPLDPTLLALRHYAYGLNETGDVIIGAYYYDVVDDSGWARNVAKGFLWLADARGGTLIDLQEYLALRGQPFLNEWLDVIPTAVSGDGRYLVGWGADSLGSLRGWRIDFGSAVQATDPLPASSRYSVCPRGGRPATSAPLTEASQTSQEWARPDGVFRAADGRYYRVNPRGALLYGGPSDPQMQQLLSLGGDHYYDLKAHARLTVVRDTAGQVKAIRMRQKNTTSIFHWQSPGW